MVTKTTVLIAAILLLTGGFQQAKLKSAQSDWIVFSPKNGGFSVKLPSKPTERSLPQSTEPGQTPSPMYELESGGLKYVITYKDHPFSEAAQSNEFLEKAAEAGITGAGGKVLLNKPISLEGYPGREVKGEMAGWLYQSRIYLVKQRLYLLIVWLPADQTGSENAAKFFESFQTRKNPSIPKKLLNHAQRDSRSAVDAPRFVLLEGRFSVSLPDRSGFRLTKVTIATPFGNVPGDLYEWRTNEWTFGVGYADSFQPIKDLEVQKVFDGAIERFRTLALANGGKIAEVKKITLDNHPGIEQRADLSGGSFIQRNYVVTRRIYQTLVVVKNNQRAYETAVGLLDSFKLLSDAEITEEALKAGPGPLPQTPEAPRAGTDADDEGLRGPVKSVRTEVQYISEKPVLQGITRSWLTTYNEKRNKLRTESYDLKNNLYLIEVFGYIDGARVSASKFIQREYGPPVGSGGAGPERSNRKMDPRYDHRFEFKYDEKKRLIEKTDFLSNGDILWRRIYKYDGNQREEMLYSGKDWLSGRHLYILDDKGNAIERTDFERDGSVRSKISFTYEFDSHGNWTKRTSSWNVVSDRMRRLDPASVHLRTITYY